MTKLDAFAAGVLVTLLTVSVIMAEMQQDRFPPPPPADNAHRTVQETCIKCHIAKGVIK